MEREFIPYELALELKELGFDEKCVAYYKSNILKEKGWDYTESQSKVNYIFGVNNDAILAPLYQQAFRWFRKKYGKDSLIARCSSTKGYFFDISWRNKKEILKDFQSKDFSTYEEAELECLKKLIEIVKNK